MERYTVTVVHLNTQSELSIIIEADEAETTEDIILSTQIEDSCFSASNYGYFEAFQELRDKLLQNGYGVKCVGSKVNAVQSSMASATYKVYEAVLGKQTAIKDLICLYDYANIDEFPNTKTQNEFLQKWIHSLRK